MALQIGFGRGGDKQYAPYKSEHSGSNPEGNHIGERIELPAEVTGSIRHPGNAAVQAIEKHREAERLGCDRKMRIEAVVSTPRLHGSFEDLQDGYEAQEDIAAGEQSRQRISCAPWPFARRAQP